MRVTEPTCTVVICTRDRPAELERCLRAVRQIEYPRFDVLVIDNAPIKAPAREAAERWDARYVVEPVRGVSRARNRGALESSSELVVYIDDDEAPERLWLAALIREFREPRIVAVTGRILPFVEQPNSIRFLDSGTDRHVLDTSVPEWFEITAFGGLAKTGNMAIRSSVFRDWPGFDVRLGRGTPLLAAEDNHAFLSLVDRGFSVVYTPEAVVRHSDPETITELRALHLQCLKQIGLYIGFLLDQPRYRGEVIRYVLSRIGGRRRQRQQTSTHLAASPTRDMLEVFKGIALYTRLRLTGKISI
jgi:O-antigen biosynthesis protein